MTAFRFALLLVWLLGVGQGAQGGEGLDPFSNVSGAVQAPERELLRFSNTQKWEEKYKPYLQKQTRILKDAERLISIPPPPANSSARTRRELDYLLELQALRTPEQILQIETELQMWGFTMGNLSLTEVLKGEDHPKTARLLEVTNEEFWGVIFKAKQHFDRVRPTYLEPRLEPSIEMPNHPAYPSGHATQAFVLAYLFQELAPDQSDAFVASAAQIARNREIAGVHYPSDSEAGRLLARQIVDLLLSDLEFQELLTAAREEW